jgi:hypothetical protein
MNKRNRFRSVSFLLFILSLLFASLWLRSKCCYDVLELEHAAKDWSKLDSFELVSEKGQFGLAITRTTYPSSGDRNRKDSYDFTYRFGLIDSRSDKLAGEARLKSSSTHGFRAVGYGFAFSSEVAPGIKPQPGWKPSATTLPAPLQVRYWLILVPYLLVIAAFAVVPIVTVLRRIRASHRASRGRCRECGYDIRASGDHCPECGEER